MAAKGERAARRGKFRVPNAHAIEARTVARSRIDDAPHSAVSLNFTVKSRNRAIGQHDVVRRVRSDTAFVAVMRDRPEDGCAGVALDRDGQAGQRDLLDERDRSMVCK